MHDPRSQKPIGEEVGFFLFCFVHKTESKFYVNHKCKLRKLWKNMYAQNDYVPGHWNGRVLDIPIELESYGILMIWAWLCGG